MVIALLLAYLAIPTAYYSLISLFISNILNSVIQYYTFAISDSLLLCTTSISFSINLDTVQSITFSSVNDFSTPSIANPPLHYF